MPSITTDRPLKDAVDMLSGKVPVGSGMSSREWEDLHAEIKLRSMFAARVENEHILAEMQSRLQVRIELAKKDGRTMDRGVFIEEMREELRKFVYKRGDAKRGSLRDLKSTRRLGLIWDMNLAQAQGYAKWKGDMAPDILDAVPAQELIRVRAKVEIRDWPLVWADHGGKFYGEPGPDYPGAPGRMIALKTDPIWRYISRFKTPWPPYDWGSGMGLKNVRRAQAEALGVLAPGATLIPLAAPFNAGHEMSAKGVPESGRESLRSAFGDAIRFDGDRILLQRETSPETYEQSKQDITSSLRERARDQFLQAREKLDRLQRKDDGTEVGFRGEGESEIASIYLAQASAVTVGRKQLFHDTMTQAEAETLLAVTDHFPSQVAAHYEEGHLLMWRRDLLDAKPEALMAEMDSGGGGIPLGYGLNSPAFRTPHVLVRIFTLPRRDGDLPVTGFHAPVKSWRAYANARARDIADAWGVETETESEVFP